MTLPVLLMIGYWLARRRTKLDDIVAEEPALVMVPKAVVDTERGRMS